MNEMVRDRDQHTCTPVHLRKLKTEIFEYENFDQKQEEDPKVDSTTDFGKYWTRHSTSFMTQVYPSMIQSVVTRPHQSDELPPIHNVPISAEGVPDNLCTSTESTDSDM